MKKILFIIILVISIFACEDKSTEPNTPTIFDVEYTVGGSAGTVNITIENEDGGTSQYSDVVVPWSYEFRAEEGSFVYVSAQNQGESGSVITRILRNGDEFKVSTSSGAYVIASCSGLL